MAEPAPAGTLRDVVVIGGSAGAVRALGPLIRGLPATLPAAVAIVIHRAAGYRSWLAQLLGNGAAIRVIEPAGGERFSPGQVHVAPAGFHMTLGGGMIRLDRGPKQHHTRPAIDPLFASAARCYGPRVLGVLLTGGLSDGVAGLITIKGAGGLSVVQDPGEAEFPSMPTNALRHDHVDLVAGLPSMPQLIAGLVAGHSLDQLTERLGPEVRWASRRFDDEERGAPPARCPVDRARRSAVEPRPVEHLTVDGSRAASSLSSEEAPMNKDQIEGTWEQLKGKAKRIWGELTDDDFQKAEGSADKLYGTIQRRFGDAREQILEKLKRDEMKH